MWQFGGLKSLYIHININTTYTYTVEKLSANYVNRKRVDLKQEWKQCTPVDLWHINFNGTRFFISIECY